MRALKQAQDGLKQILDLSRDPAHGGLAMDRGKFIAELQKTANRLSLRTTDQKKRGGLEDFGSEFHCCIGSIARNGEPAGCD